MGLPLGRVSLESSIMAREGSCDLEIFVLNLQKMIITNS